MRQSLTTAYCILALALLASPAAPAQIALNPLAKPPGKPADRSHALARNRLSLQSGSKIRPGHGNRRWQGLRLMVRRRRRHPEHQTGSRHRQNHHRRRRELGPQTIPAHLDAARRPDVPQRRHGLYLGPLRRHIQRPQRKSRQDNRPIHDHLEENARRKLESRARFQQRRATRRRRLL